MNSVADDDPRRERRDDLDRRRFSGAWVEDRAGRPPRGHSSPRARNPSTMARRAQSAEQVRAQPGDAQDARAGVRADHGADLRDQLRVAPVDLAAALGQALGLGAAPGRAGWRSRRSRPRGAARGARRAARTRGDAVRTRSTGCISPSIVRIGLTFSVAPIHARAAPIRPPRRRYSSVSTMTMILRFSRIARAAATAPARSAPRVDRVGRGDGHEAVPGAAGQRVDHDHPLGRHPALDQQVARLLGRAHRAGDAAAEVDREDVVAALDQRLVDGEEVAHATAATCSAARPPLRRKS